MHVPHSLRCERAQRETRTHTLGSNRTFAPSNLQSKPQLDAILIIAREAGREMVRLGETHPH